MLCKNKVLYKTEELYFENMMSKKAYHAMYNGWSGNFRRNVMPLINEDIFAPLYSEKKSRPAEPVNVLFSIFSWLSCFTPPQRTSLPEHPAMCQSGTLCTLTRTGWILRPAAGLCSDLSSSVCATISKPEVI